MNMYNRIPVCKNRDAVEAEGTRISTGQTIKIVKNAKIALHPALLVSSSHPKPPRCTT